MKVPKNCYKFFFSVQVQEWDSVLQKEGERTDTEVSVEVEARDLEEAKDKFDRKLSNLLYAR